MLDTAKFSEESEDDYNSNGSSIKKSIKQIKNQ